MKILEEKFTKRAQLLMFESKVFGRRCFKIKLLFDISIFMSDVFLVEVFMNLIRCARMKLRCRWTALEDLESLRARPARPIVKCAIAIILLIGELISKACGTG